MTSEQKLMIQELTENGIRLRALIQEAEQSIIISQEQIEENDKLILGAKVRVLILESAAEDDIQYIERLQQQTDKLNRIYEPENFLN